MEDTPAMHSNTPRSKDSQVLTEIFGEVMRGDVREGKGPRHPTDRGFPILKAFFGKFPGCDEGGGGGGGGLEHHSVQGVSARAGSPGKFHVPAKQRGQEPQSDGTVGRGVLAAMPRRLKIAESWDGFNKENCEMFVGARRSYYR